MSLITRYRSMAGKHLDRLERYPRVRLTAGQPHPAPDADRAHRGPVAAGVGLPGPAGQPGARAALTGAAAFGSRIRVSRNLPADDPPEISALQGGEDVT